MAWSKPPDPSPSNARPHFCAVSLLFTGEGLSRARPGITSCIPPSLRYALLASTSVLVQFLHRHQKGMTDMGKRAHKPRVGTCNPAGLTCYRFKTVVRTTQQLPRRKKTK